jgi:parallel beta-helix repeat protein
MKKSLFLLIFLSAISSSSAKIISVPGQYQIIQDAVYNSADGDTIIVAPGEYEQQVSFLGKKVVLASRYLTTNDRAYIDSTRLFYGQNLLSTVYFGGEDSCSKIIGFTIGSESLGCNGILCENSSPVISENTFITNNKYGIKCRENSNPFISKNIFSGNYPYNFYICVDVFFGSARITGNLFAGSMRNAIRLVTAIRTGDAGEVLIQNNTIKNIYYGIEDAGDTKKISIINNLIYGCCSGIICGYTSSPLLVNNTIANNTECGISAAYGIPEITNSIIWGNKKDFSGTFSISHCCMSGCLPFNAADRGSNIFRDPQFVDPANDDFRLKGISPGIDAGCSDSLINLLSEYDIDFNRRIQDGNGDGNSIIDLGCFEKSEAVNPAFVSGTITLTGGSGRVGDAEVGIGTTVHPDSSGKYIFAVSAPDSIFDVYASIDKYLTKIVKDVEIRAGTTTQNVDINLEAYEPDKILGIQPDTLIFSNTVCSLKLKNLSLIDVYVRWIEVNRSVFYFEEDSFPIPHYIRPGDSCEFAIFLVCITGVASSHSYDYLQADSIIIYFNNDTCKIPALYDPTYIGIIGHKNGNSITFELLQNYPNPFNPSTTIHFSIPSKSFVTLKVFDLLGREAAILVNEELPDGNYSRQFKADNLASGIYFYRLQAGQHIETRKLIVLR